jgi:rhodanese-related sulfurtransferase
MKLINSLIITSALMTGSFATEFVNYHNVAEKLLAQEKKNGLNATAQDVRNAIKSKDTVVVDVRTDIEWASAHIRGSYRVGRESPEKMVEPLVLDDDGKFVKTKLIVVCNTAHRASLEAVIFRKMGFTEVKTYGIDEWIDECNPVMTHYSTLGNPKGKNHLFGDFYTKDCEKK